MAVLPNGREFDVRASIMLYVDGEEHKRLTVENPVFYSSRNFSLVVMQTLPKAEGHICALCGIHDPVFKEELRTLKVIVKHAVLNKDIRAKYRDALNYFKIDNIQDLVTTYQDGSRWLNLQIEVKITPEDKINKNVRGPARKHLTIFRFRILNGHPDHADSKPLTDWINLNPCGFELPKPKLPSIEESSATSLETTSQHLKDIAKVNTYQHDQAELDERRKLILIANNLEAIRYRMENFYRGNKEMTISDIFDLQTIRNRLVSEMYLGDPFKSLIPKIDTNLDQDENLLILIDTILKSHLSNMINKTAVDNNDFKVMYNVLEPIGLESLKDRLLAKADSLSCANN